MMWPPPLLTGFPIFFPAGAHPGMPIVPGGAFAEMCWLSCAGFVCELLETGARWRGDVWLRIGPVEIVLDPGLPFLGG